jgi:8-oxo-dGTP pyrophosphatase MutT (NUDIX family)/phosphohistidine phosphatase SixA
MSSEPDTSTAGRPPLPDERAKPRGGRGWADGGEATEAGAGEPGDIKVVAAGALCWRTRNGQLEVLMIHRPRYKDWSWPKGKLDEGETTPECAVREVREEAGVGIRLGIPLPAPVYPVASGMKIVHYWAARIQDGTPEPDGKEVDGVRWCSPEEAHAGLTNPSDRLPLHALEEAHAEGRLRTWPLIIVRHAKAKPRSSWTRAEGDRPLAATGLRQAQAVSRLLAAWLPDRVVSSPWVRCVQTVRPYVKTRSVKFKTVDAITERSAKRKPGKARNAVEAQFDKGKPVVLCTHRPVLPVVFEVLARHMPAGLSIGLPSKDPYLAPGEAIICQVSTADEGRIVSLERFRAFDD